MKKIVIVILILAIVTSIAFWLKRTEVKTEDRFFFGYIRDVSLVNLKGHAAVLMVDEAEFLSGEEARQKGAKDTECAPEKIEECIPSMNNDSYIRNVSKETKPYRVDKNTDISILDPYGSPVLASSTLEKLLEVYNSISNGDKIIHLEEQYTP